MIESPILYPTTGRMRDVPERLRPREYAQRVGIEHAPENVLLALILRTGAQGVNAMQLADGLLLRYGSLTELAKAPEKELAQVRGVGPVTAQILRAALEVGRRLSREALPERMPVRTPEEVARVLHDQVRRLDTETFWVLLLDVKNRLLRAPEPVTNGLLDASLVHPREVFRSAIRLGCAAVILAHNHPSGDPTPSAEDLRITRQLIDAGRILDIRVLDHVILGAHGRVGTADYHSLRESGTVAFG